MARKKKSSTDHLRTALDNFYELVRNGQSRETGRVGSSLCGWKPLLSDALAVHPTQIAEARESASKKGVPTDFDPKYGRPIFTSRQHRKKYCEAYGVFDRDGGYGDAQKGSYKGSYQSQPEETPFYDG